jgi:hypothetical protein
MLAHRADNSLDATLASDSLPAFVSSEAAGSPFMDGFGLFMECLHSYRQKQFGSPFMDGFGLFMECTPRAPSAQEIGE